MRSHLTRLDPRRFGPWALVTGASSGIGEAFARQLAASGLNVVLVARRGSLLEQLGRDLQATYRIDYRVVVLDLTSDDVLTPVRVVTDDLDIGLVISNAGGPLPGEFLRQSTEVLFGQVRLDVTAPLEWIHHL